MRHSDSRLEEKGVLQKYCENLVNQRNHKPFFEQRSVSRNKTRITSEPQKHE